MNSPNKESGYEQTVKRLEEVIKALENENLDLDQSMKLYEEGAELYQKARKMLSSREEKALEIINLLEDRPAQVSIEDLKEE